MTCVLCRLTVANTEAVVTFFALTLANYGTLQARVGTPGFNGSTVYSLFVDVGTVVPEPPVLNSPADVNVTTNVVSIRCSGMGFDNQDASNQNVISFFTLDNQTGTFVAANVTANATSATTRESLEMLFTFLDPGFSGELYAALRILTDLSSSVSTSPTVLVANVQSVIPVLTFSNATILSTATYLTLAGFGLNDVALGQQSIVLRSNASRTVAAELVTPSSRTSLTVRFLDLAAADAGPLFATVLLQYSNGSALQTVEQQVATVEVRARRRGAWACACTRGCVLLSCSRAYNTRKVELTPTCVCVGGTVCRRASRSSAPSCPTSGIQTTRCTVEVSMKRIPR